MADWSAAQYLKFEKDRTRPASELLARVPLRTPSRIVDIGCGPGNSTELLAGRFPGADILGFDPSSDMLEAARRRLPQLRFEQADVTSWAPDGPVDLLFSNAVFQWVPDHVGMLVRLMQHLRPGGVLAVQMPDNMDEASHVAMRETAADGPWRERLARVSRETVAPPADYYDALVGTGAVVDVWHTIYYHVLADADALMEWVKGTGLRPYLDPLGPEEQAGFLKAYRRRIAAAYPPRADGRVLFAFPRIFIVAVRA